MRCIHTINIHARALLRYVMNVTNVTILFVTKPSFPEIIIISYVYVCNVFILIFHSMNLYVTLVFNSLYLSLFYIKIYIYI